METLSSTEASPPAAAPSKALPFEGEHVRIWPYIRGSYPRDILYHLWRVIEAEGAGPHLFYGHQDDPATHADLPYICEFFDRDRFPRRQLILVQSIQHGDFSGCYWLDDIQQGFRAFASVFIRRRDWGQPTMEAARLSMAYSFLEFDLQALWAMSPWPTAQSLCRRLGFQEMGAVPEVTKIDGTLRTVTMYRLKKEDYHG